MNPRLCWKLVLTIFTTHSLLCGSAWAVDATTATIQALRMAGIITGGAMPASAPEFASMVSSIEAGNYTAAATTAVSSGYFAGYLPRRMARQMMNPQLSEGNVPDNDATTLIVANWIGSGTTASIKSIWSQNATYLVNVAGVNTHIGAMTAAQIAAINWKTDLVQVAGQTALVTSTDASNNTIFTPTPIPAQHVGGFMTLNNVDPNGNGASDLSFVQYGLKDGTNLRAIEALYETSLGLTLPQMVVTGATSAVVPRFIPKLNPSFSVGQNQPACISCHGGGASNLVHGYATFADVFDFDPDHGIIYIPSPTTDSMKSYGSNGDYRSTVKNCNLSDVPAPLCNPDGPAASATQAWNLTLWQTGGMLANWGWQGPTSGSGLNQLGIALGQAQLVYQFLTRRVQREICPLGTFSNTTLNSIAQTAQTQDSFSSIVVAIASDPSCL
jgi:hypothetical protein